MADAMHVQDLTTHVPSELAYAVMYVPPCRHAMQADDRKHGHGATAAGYHHQQIDRRVALDLRVRRDLDDHADRSDGSRFNSGPDRGWPGGQGVDPPS